MNTFLEQTTRYLFFTGKGGVGKTALACATAIRLADAGRRILLVSTDPASNLDEMLGVQLSQRPTPIPGVDRLWALNIDPEQTSVPFDHVLFDTAPTGHTLRLLSLPARLQDDLRRAKIEPYAWIINSSLAAAGSSDRCLRQRIAGELEQIEIVRGRHARRIAIVPWTVEEPIGPARLLSLARHTEGSS